MAQFNVSSLIHRLGDRKQAVAADSQDSKKILYVCTGNIARSASAQYLSLAMAGPDSSWSFDSAGVGAVVGAPVAPHIDQELDRRGVDYSTHRAKQITQQLVSEASLILVMEQEHLNWLVHEWPQHRSKIHLLGQVARLRQQAGRRVDPVAFMHLHDEAPRKGDGIADPYRKGPEAARVAVEEIEEALKVLIPWLGA